MSRIIYLLGAGASRGKRTFDNQKPSDLNKKTTDDNKDTITNTIEEGLPTVLEIPSRLDYIIYKIKNIQLSEKEKSLLLPLNNFPSMRLSDAMQSLIEDFQWLKKQNAAHATIDTFAKKLYLKKDENNFIKLKHLLSIYFILEQFINKPDNRYDTFLANILTSELKIPQDITILTWNYDSQFEIAFNEYTKIEIPKDISVCNPNDIGEDICSNPKIFKLNGSASYDKMYSLGKLINETTFDSSNLTTILNYYVKHERQFMKNNLTFAWEDFKFNSYFTSNINSSLPDANTLVVIGYSFPFFNREKDRFLFEKMESLKTIYIQDPNAVQLIQNVTPVLSNTHKTNKIHIEPLTNTDQFFLPPEL